ncbi:MAG: tetratricopeptide repeat protein [Theionarchaea archaeon]|nr:tetratricopeptide repeat protein [Theionarchaea archaeon]
MQVSERRRKILGIIYEEGPLSYKKILDKISKVADIIEILSDIDTLVFFRFLQNVKDTKSEIKLETVLELRPKTEKQMRDYPSRIDFRLQELEREFPPWYRKLTILKLLDGNPMNSEEIETAVPDRYPHVRWPSPLVHASLRILKKSTYKEEEEKEREKYITLESGKYTLASGGKKLLKNNPFEQFFDLRELKDEFTTEFRAHVILDMVRDHNEFGISSGKITRYLQSEYGMRGNKRKAIRNTLENMVFAGLLKVLGSTNEREGHVYQSGSTAKSLPTIPEVDVMDTHSTQDFKKTVEQFLGKYKISNVDIDKISSLKQILNDFEQCRQDMSQRSAEEWITHIVTLSDYLRSVTAKTWEKRAFRCITACLLSRLVPPEVSVRILTGCPPPSPESKEQYHYYDGIEREYYFNLTETYLSMRKDEEAFRSFEDLKKVGWQFFEFLVLRGKIEMRKGEFQKALKTFEKAEKKAKGREQIVALFYKGLTHFQRGNFKKTEEAWTRCLNTGTFDQKIIISHNLANLYRLTGNLEEAKTLYEDIAAAARFSEMGEFKVKSLIGLANVLIDQCSWEEAEKILRDIIEVCTERMTVVTGLAKTNLGVLLGRKGKLEKALEYHRNALNLVDKDLHSQECGTILINVGDTLRQLKEMDEAMAAFKKALKVIPSETKILLQALQISLAELYFDMGDLNKSWELAHSVLLERWLDNRHSEAEAYRIQGKILLCQNECEKAKKQLMKSEGIFKEYNLNYELIEVFQLLEECYRALGNEKQEAFYRSQRETLTQKIGLPTI